MTIIAFPPGIRAIEWTAPERAAFLVQSGWTGSQTVGDLGANRSGWLARVEVVPGRPEHAAEWRAWFMAMKGPVNTALLDPSDGGQRTRPMPIVLVAGVGQTGATLNCDGALANLPMVARAGDVVTIAGRGHVVLANAASDGSGTVALTLEPPIVTAPADNAEVRVQVPLIEMRLAGSQWGWASEPGDVTRPFGFEMLEALA